jgi:ribose 5-phosphate isomerase B
MCSVGGSPAALVGYDAGGVALVPAIRVTCQRLGVTYEEIAGSGQADYPEIAFAGAEAVAAGKYGSAILVCGTGLGMSIAANKVRGVRAARCTDEASVVLARTNSHANVLTFGPQMVSEELAMRLVELWFGSSFSSRRSIDKIARIAAYEERR